MDNYSLTGGNMQEIDGTTFQQCKYACLDTTDCAAVVWVKSGNSKGKCKIKNDKHDAPTVTNDPKIAAKIDCNKTEGKQYTQATANYNGCSKFVIK